MIHLFLDACALARRYFYDVGSRNIDQLFGLTDSAYLTDMLGIPETAGALRSTFENPQFPTFRRQQFDAAIGLLTNHWRTQYQVLQIDPQAASDATALIYHHNLRGGDAVHLALALKYRDAVLTKEPNDTIIVVTSDDRLADAATAKGLKVFHFWQCQCPSCGVEFRPRKYNMNTCPGCNFTCRCGGPTCTSTYEITAEKLLAL